ncbi:MAG: YkgJ family cysteine cluster protein [Treponema sp.]|jgi:Fe-S-cluster containining protein|nr:YkgJ family cysteine cluster protein [Treponema sp.]
MTDTSFFSAGLKFSCKRCSACCRYEAGFVYLSKNDMEKLTGELKTDSENFIKSYCRWVTDRRGKEVLSLREKGNKDCIFWDKCCKIYDARPLQCRTFPFWESIVSSAQSWEIAASGCPGMNSGKLHTGKAITDCLEKRSAQPIICRRGK